MSLLVKDAIIMFQNFEKYPTRLGGKYFLSLHYLVGLLVFWTLVTQAVAQEVILGTERPARIAYFAGAKTTSIAGQTPLSEVVKERITKALEQFGHKRNDDFVIDVFSTEGDNAKLKEVGERIVRSRPTLVYAASWDAANQIKALTSTIPVVFSVWANLDSPNYRLIGNLQNPEGNMTGFTSYVNLIPKKLQLLKESFPQIQSVGFVYGVDIRDERRAEYSEAAKKLGISLNYRKVTKDEIPRMHEKLDANADGALLIAHDDLLLYNRDAFLRQLAQVRTPVIHPEEATSKGVLMHYFSVLGFETKVAEYISKLLRGAKIKDLAVQEPQEFDLSVNVTTLKRNGLTMSRDVLSRARKVE